MANRPEDIKELEGGCPLFNSYGYCAYGISCRFGSSHITKSGENIRKSVDPSIADDSVPLEYEPGLNLLLPKEAQNQLRKRTFPFKCKMHFEKNPDSKEPSGESNQEAKSCAEEEKTAVSSSTPIELKTRKIIDFSNKIYVAPLTTVGNLPFRRIMKKFGADITCGEMALGTCLLEGKQSEWALLKRHPDEDIFGVQVAAAHPDQFTRVSELVEEFVAPDFMDLNLGCPLDLLCNKGAGASLMLREKKLKGALMGITATLSCPVTIKMRTGWDMNDPFAHKLVGKIQSWQMDGIGAIMVGSISHSQNSFPDTHRYSSRVSILDSVNSPLVQ
jgi:tRNA-dihydrouridine synthase 3